MRFWIVSFIAFGLMACEPSAPSANQVTDSAVDHNAFVQHYFALFNQHEWSKLADLYADNAQFKDPSFGTETVTQTKDEFIKKYSELATIFPDINDNVKAIYPAGAEHVVVEFVSTGSAGDGTKLNLPICTIFEIKNGKISKDFTYYDNQ